MCIKILRKLVVLSCAMVICEIVCVDLKAPELLRVEAIEPASLYVTWKEIEQSLADRVFGYKIRIYEIPESSESEIKLINAEEYPAMVRSDEALEKFRKDSTIPVTREVKINRDAKTAIIDDIKYNKLYEVRILAFKGDEDGPISAPIRIKILKDADYRAVVSRTLKECQISVSHQLSTSDETYPYVYNAYL